MIRYALVCEAGHGFDSWFQNSAAFDNQAKRALVACPHCGSAKVEKAIMAPRLGRAESLEPRPPVPDPATAPPLQPAPMPPPAPPPKSPNATVALMSPAEREFRHKLKELRDHVTKNANYVGSRFSEEARKMHYGEIERRSIYGEASPDEAKELNEEGIEFHPLPNLPDEMN